MVVLEVAVLALVVEVVFDVEFKFKFEFEPRRFSRERLSSRNDMVYCTVGLETASFFGILQC
jgi:hypothetical protein